MVRFGIGTAIAGMVMLTGCGTNEAATNATAAANVAAAATPRATDYLRRIAALPEGQQRIVLFRAIRDAGQQCQELVRVAQLPDAAGRAVWNADCRGGARFRIDIGADGIANVTGPIAY